MKGPLGPGSLDVLARLSRSGGSPTKPAKGDLDQVDVLHSQPRQFALTVEAENEATLDAILNILARLPGVRVTVANPEGA